MSDAFDKKRSKNLNLGKIKREKSIKKKMLKNRNKVSPTNEKLKRSNTAMSNVISCANVKVLTEELGKKRKKTSNSYTSIYWKRKVFVIKKNESI